MILFVVFFVLCTSMPNFSPLNRTIDVHSVIIDKSLCSHYSFMHVKGEHNTLNFERRTLSNNDGLILKYARTYYILRCENITLQNGRIVRESGDWFNEYVTDSAVLSNDVAFPENMQHEIINGITSLTLGWHFFVANKHVKILTGPYVRKVLEKFVDNERLLSIRKDRQRFKQLFILAPNWEKGDTWDCYSTHVLAEILKLYPAIVDSVPTRKKVIYFSRDDTKKRTVQSFQCVRKEDVCLCEPEERVAFHSAIRERVEALGFDYAVFHPVGFDEDIALIRSAHAVFGPHGGAFMNLIWLYPNSKVIEINAGDRQCYACLTGSVDAQYYRYIPLFWPKDYDSDGTIQVDSYDFVEFLAAILQDKRPQTFARPCKVKLSK